MTCVHVLSKNIRIFLLHLLLFNFATASASTPASTTTTTSKGLANKTNKSIAIVGAGGFIGSELFVHLNKSTHLSVVGYDHDPQVLLHHIATSTGRDISTHQLQQFDVVIYLGGCTGRKACAVVSTEQVYASNVQAVVDIAKRMTTHQTLIFASSSAVVDHRKDCAMPVTEAETNSVSLLHDVETFESLDRYTQHMILRETSLLELVDTFGNAIPTLIGLRFGTVGGVSVSQRIDLLTNAIVRAAYVKGVITGMGPDKNRPVLWMADALRAVETIIDKDDSNVNAGRFRIYHLSSFNIKVGKAVMEAGRITGADVRIQAARNQEDKCGFSLDASLFCKDFNFKFLGNLAIVLEDIDAHVPMSITAQGTHKKKDHYHKKHNKKDDHHHDHHHDHHSSQSIKCPVCGGHEHEDHQHVLSLGNQPLANAFRTSQEQALALPRFPLRLVRCTHCHHMHLDTAYDRKILFEHYLYESGTSATLRKYFQWLASKVTNEIIVQNASPSISLSVTRTVLEIASNDGSQLDEFKTLGWQTIGVDPAKNLAQSAKDRGHRIVVGFWGENVNASSLPTSMVSSLDAIVAQNVLAHVVSPIKFLKACFHAMGKHTKLYVQTSQCDMHTKGQFDTSYHEHISFFTAHSFQYAATLSGLDIINYEKTPIHGTSCLVTMMKKQPHRSINTDATSPLNIFLTQELRDGITDELFYTQFNAKSQLLKAWLNDRLESLATSGYKIGGYGAAAKGMVMLNFLQGLGSKPTYKLDFVVDDAILKQNTFTPGTGIPVVTGSMFRARVQEDHAQGLGVALIIFAWNFWKEISERIVSQLSGIDGLHEIVCLLPFPRAKVVRLALRGNDSRRIQKGPLTLASLQFPMIPLSNVLSKRHAPKRKQVMLITHFYNEEILLPYWIRHHAPMFDHAILIDYQSTDSSRKIIEDLAPSTWRVVNTQAPRFTVEYQHQKTYSGRALYGGASQCDSEVAEWELKYPNDWHIALTVTEFLVTKNLRSWLASTIDRKDDQPRSFLVPSFLMVGSDDKPLDRLKSLVSQRTEYIPRSRNIATYRYDRLLHSGFETVNINNDKLAHVYTDICGRHFGTLNNSDMADHARKFGVKTHKYTEQVVILKYLWTPWPENNLRPGGRWKRELELENSSFKLLKGGLQQKKNNGFLSSNKHDLQDLHVDCANNSLFGTSCSLHQVYHESVTGFKMNGIKKLGCNEDVGSMQSHDLYHVAKKNGFAAPDWVIMDLNVSISTIAGKQKPVWETVHVEIAPPYDSLALYAAAQRVCLGIDQNFAMNELCEKHIADIVASSLHLQL